MSAIAEPDVPSRWSVVALSAVGSFFGGIVGATFVIFITLLLKRGMDAVAAQPTWLIIAVPVVGLALAVLVLEGIGRAGGRTPARGWRRWITFRPDETRADITGDVIDTAGDEERFPWRLAPLRGLAVLATVGLGGGMGTEAPAVYFGVAAGAWVCDRGRSWRKLLRSAALGGGAAGVSALMGIPLVGTAYILELGRRHDAPLSTERVTAAVVGGIVGWGIDIIFNLTLIRLVVPKEAPDDFVHALLTALFVGAVAGGVTALAGNAIYRGKKWKARPIVRLALGGLAAAAAATVLALFASPAAASGPGGGAILCAEQDTALPVMLLVVALLRAAVTAADAAAGGCGGIFVPFLAIGDLAGRVTAPGLGIGHDLAGAAGAAAGIASGYRLPFTAIAMVLGYGGPRLATLTCLATVAIAYVAGVLVDRVFYKLKIVRGRRRRASAPTGESAHAGRNLVPS